MIKVCSVCGKDYDSELQPATPGEEAGAFMAQELWTDAGELCPSCLANRGTLGMMYCQELFR
jgi:hypothetical protein